MKTKLTKEEENLLFVIKDKWLNFAFGVDEFIVEKFNKGIDFIYTISNLPKPKKIFVDSPLEMQYACQILKNHKQIEQQVRQQVEQQVEQQVRQQVWQQVGQQVGQQVEQQVRQQVSQQVRQYETTSYNGLFCDIGWMSFYDFFKKIKIIKSKNWDKYNDFLKSGVYDTILFNNFAIGCRKPQKVLRNSQFQMHSETEPAISWRDGFRLNYLNGVYFPEDLWKKVVSGKMPFEEILAIKDIDQRTQAMKYGDKKKFLEHTKSIMLDKSERSGELWKTPKEAGIFQIDAYHLIYLDPYTKKEYMSGIEPSIGVKGSADEAMSWKHNLSLKEYASSFYA